MTGIPRLESRLPASYDTDCRQPSGDVKEAGDIRVFEVCLVFQPRKEEDLDGIIKQARPGNDASGLSAGIEHVTDGRTGR